MSRLVVKNLPNKITSEKLKEIFSQKGEITDVQLKYTKDGKFRNFGFIGFRTEEQAAEAQKYFNGSCIKTTKISAEVCASLGDASKPRAWSKYAPDSTAYAKLNIPDVEVDKTKDKKKDKKKKKKKENKIKEILQKHKDDPLFAEFIDAHANDKTSWLKEALNQPSDDEPDSGVEDEGEEQDAIEPESVEVEAKVKKHKTANKNISDLEYMKSLVKKKSKTKEADDIDDVEVKVKKGDTPKMKRELFHIKINNLPYKCKKRDIKQFFRPLVPFTIRFPLAKGQKVAGFCYVGFRTEDELTKALFKDKLFLGNHRLHISKHENKSENHEAENVNNVKRRTQEENLQNEESIGESGRIFARNLPYITNEDELTKLFEKYGPLAEINMPVDKLLRQPKGFATVTFVMPEHAVRAYSELDGSVFSGRMMHLLPGKAQQTGDGEDDEGLTFKEKKAKKLKSQAKSSHNWNTLFLAANAVADVIADTYDTTKEQLLNEHSSKTSAAVRLALGETQLVSETRSFLEENGVCLDAFTQAGKKRSKTCILVKNLPARTTSDEIRPLFEKHGLIARFVMPKHGISALIEFVEPSEARSAFTKLAYSQFKSSPLYLEWAPDNAFLRPADKVEAKVPVKYTDSEKKVEESLEEEKIEVMKKEESSPVEEVEDENPESDTTLFIKNLNFKTTETSLREHFQGCGKLHSATVAKKKDPNNPGNFLSMGYGFVQFFTKKATNKALKELQYSTLDGKTLELKRSDRGNNSEVKTAKKSSSGPGKQTGSKILVRNVPFQANRNELHEIFRAFGEIKTLRLPKKLTQGDDQHRGFCFVDYYNQSDSKMAFEALCHSTHLYGRRLVLEWADQTDENEDVDALRKRTAQAFNQQTPGGKRFKKSVVDAENMVE